MEPPWIPKTMFHVKHWQAKRTSMNAGPGLGWQPGQQRDGEGLLRLESTASKQLAMRE